MAQICYQCGRPIQGEVVYEYLLEDGKFDSEFCMRLHRARKFAQSQGASFWEHASWVDAELQVIGATDPLTEAERIAVWYHDAVEEKRAIIQEVIGHGGFEVGRIVDIVSRRDGEKYSEYIQRIIDSRNHSAIKVKVADMRHNSKNPPGGLAERYAKYLPLLEAALKRGA